MFPHTDRLHVVERFRMIEGGKTLEVNVNVEDPGAFTTPWNAIQCYRRVERGPMNQQRADAMVVSTNPFFVTRAKLIAALAARHGLPAIYARREFAAAGGLMSYGYDVADGYRQMGNYAGRISAADHWAVSRSAYSPS
jgi:hypothetical protein